MRLGAVFSDYDGTLAPDGVPRGQSAVPSNLADELRALAGRVPFGIITSKDRRFIIPRVPYARAWACVCGLEVQLSDGHVISTPPIPDAQEVLDSVRRMVADGVVLEEKSGLGGALGFSVDWRASAKPPELLLKRILELTTRGFCVSHHTGYPYVDVFFGPADKGRALSVLKRKLKVKGPVTFIGDSPLDNSAFREADMSIGVSHGQRVDDLECEFLVDHSNMTRLVHLLSRDPVPLPLSADWIRRR